VELIISLILLVILIIPPLFLAGRKVLNRRLSDEAGALFGKRSEAKDVQWENGPVYDGMITVKLPVTDIQVIAYEPLPDIGFGADDEIVVVEPVSRASRA